jgi:hypothetical protein
VQLHRVRNRIQHGAIIPNLSTVERFKRCTENVMPVVLEKAFRKMQEDTLFSP